MELLKDVIYDEKPNNVMIFPTSVYIVKSCEEIEDNYAEDEPIQIKFLCDVEVYSINEYVLMMQKNSVTWDDLALALQEGVDSI